jgi:putative drug exporter of the RND superfamily
VDGPARRRACRSCSWRSQAARLDPRIPRGDWLPPSIESARGIADLRAMGCGGVVQSLRLVLELPETTTALEREGWEAQRRLGDRLAADPRVARVQSLPGIAGDRADDLAYAALLPAIAKRTFLGSEGELALLEVIPRGERDPEDVAALVRELRRADPGAITGLAGARLRVGGLPAFNADYEDAVGGRMGPVVALVVATTLVVLFLAFRSVLVPLKAVPSTSCRSPAPSAPSSSSSRTATARGSSACRARSTASSRSCPRSSSASSSG